MGTSQIPLFSDLLHTYRKEIGLTQEQLAEKLG